MMEKKVLWIAVIVLGGLFIVGFQAQFNSGRYQLSAQQVTREYYANGSEIPNKTEKIDRLFKVDAETGSVWVYKEEYYEAGNNEYILKQYFDPLPVERKYSEAIRNR
ncbi:MAG: hypothetical protein ACYTER_05890 [Planctomycetota bacterium]